MFTRIAVLYSIMSKFPHVVANDLLNHVLLLLISMKTILLGNRYTNLKLFIVPHPNTTTISTMVYSVYFHSFLLICFIN